MPPSQFNPPRIRGRDVHADMRRLARDLGLGRRRERLAHISASPGMTIPAGTPLQSAGDQPVRLETAEPLVVPPSGEIREAWVIERALSSAEVQALYEQGPPERVAAPVVPMQASPAVNLGEIRSRRFDIIDRARVPVPRAVSRIVEALMARFRRPEPEPMHGPVHRRSRYERLVSALLV